MAYTPDFEIAHIGVNCADAAQTAALRRAIAVLFKLAVNPAKGKCGCTVYRYQIEWMKAPGRGEHGHIALATGDLPAARRYLEEKGFAFDEDSVKRFPDGRILVIYAKQQIGGFAIHLMQK